MEFKYFEKRDSKKVGKLLSNLKEKGKTQHVDMQIIGFLIFDYSNYMCY